MMPLLWWAVACPVPGTATLDAACTTSFFRDDDGDGFGDPQDVEGGCDPPAGYVVDDTDCDDARDTVYPGAPDVCDDVVDNDCDGAPDPQEADADADGTSICAGDCDDAVGDVGPEAVEVCNGIDDDCDGGIDGLDVDAALYACGYCPDADDYDPSRHTRSTLNPCLLDEGLSMCAPEDTHTYGRRLHRITYRTTGPWRDELLVFLPPGPGDSNQTLLDWAVHAGYRVVSVGWVNDHLGTSAATDNDSLGEALYGLDLSDTLDIAPNDALIGRLDTLLAYLVDTDPAGGWDRWYAPSDGVQWGRVVLAGWSAGATASVALAMDRPVAGVVAVSGPVGGEWLTEPSATPACAVQAFLHLEEKLYERGILTASLDALGVSTAFADTDTLDPPYGGAQSLSTRKTAYQRDYCNPHKAMGMTLCMSEELIVPYVHLYCTAPSRCE